MKFEHPFWLWVALASMVAAGGLLAWAARRRRQGLAAVIRSPLLDQLAASVDPARRRAKAILWVTGLGLVCATMARPQWGRQAVEVERTGIDLLVAVDVSRSMLAADVAGVDRLSAAREALRRLLRSLGGDRVGVIAFAGGAFVASPLTRDHVAVERVVESLGPGMVSEPGSDLAKAIQLAEQSFDRASEGPRLLLVLSDGEQFQGSGVVAAQKAVASGVRLHCAGVGSVAGARVPAAAGVGSFMKNAFGRDVVSRLDERVLRELAVAGRGEYVRLEGRESEALVGWFRRASAGLPRVGERRELGDPREWFQWPLALAVGLLLLEQSLGECRRAGTTLAARAAVLLGCGLALAPVRTSAAQAQDPAPAADRDEPWATYNRGVAAYEAGQFVAAEEAWLGLTGAALPRSLQAQVWFQVGNAEFRLGEPTETTSPEQSVEAWRRSREAFRSALGVQRRHAGALHNVALVEKRLAGLTRRLGNDLRARSEKEFLEEAIVSVRAGVEYLREARGLAPGDPEIRVEAAKAEETLRARLLERAGRQEARGDDSASRQNAYEDRQAERAYRDALADLGEALREAEMPGQEVAVGETRELREAQGRVERKLSQLLTRMGWQEKKGADNTAGYDPDEALGEYEGALAHFRAAQEVDAANRDAARGERDTQAAMERLHVSQGRQALEAGTTSAKENRVLTAAAELTAALNHFESAQALNPANQEAAAGAAEARRQLPDVLARLGRVQQKAGEREEPGSPAAALPHFEEAQASYEDALQLDPRHAPAKKGLEEVEKKLAGLRSKLAQPEPSPDGKPQPGQQPGEAKSLQQMLGAVQNPQRERERELERQRQAGVNRSQVRKVYPDW